jgi:DGQHR domain-containing protein
VDRLEDRSGGIQRRLSESKAKAVARYFELDEGNVIPTSAIIAFHPKVTKFVPSKERHANAPEGVEWGTLTFNFNPSAPHHKRPAFIVDGQHRIHGMSRVDGEELPILVSALLDADATEQAFQFVVINNKASKVSPDLVKSLIVDFDETELSERLRTARVSLQGRATLVALVDDDPDSPFYQMVDWERRRGEGTPVLKPAAIEGALNYARRRMLALDENEDALLEFFFAAWSGVRSTYKELWKKTDNQLFSNAGFRAFSEYLVDELETLLNMEIVDIENPTSVSKAAAKIASQVDVNFWKSKWTLKSLDTSAGRDIIKDDLRRIRQNRKDGAEWSSDLAVLAHGNEPF